MFKSSKLIILMFCRYFPSVMSDCLDSKLLTFILTSVCTPTFFKNPYLVSKLVEILFVINPVVQDRTEDLYMRMMSHPIAEEHLPSALMKFYTGRPFFYFFSICSLHWKTITNSCFPAKIAQSSCLVLYCI